LLSQGISERTSNLITASSASRRQGTNANYSSAWNKWSSWYDKKQVDPIRCDVNKILDDLAFLFENGYKYSTICSHRSTISAFHEKIDGKPTGEHPYVSSLINRIFTTKV